MRRVNIGKVISLLLIILFVGFIIFLVAPYYGRQSDSGTTHEQVYRWLVVNDADNPPETKANFYVIYDVAESTGYGYGHIVGRIYNNYQDVSYLSITFGIYNQNGVKTGTCIDNVSGLQLSQTWSYNASCMNLPDNFVYRIEDVSYF